MKCLLIVDDDVNTLSGLTYLLEDEGYIVHGAMNGSEALNAVANYSIDMVLCDYCLPDIDGIETCVKMKELNSNLELFLITACFDKNLVNDAKACGVERIFTKPLILDELLDSISKEENAS